MMKLRNLSMLIAASGLLATVPLVGIATAGGDDDGYRRKKKPSFRMTGGGHFICQNKKGYDVKVTHGFTLRCDGSPNNLELNWEGNRFHLEVPYFVGCEKEREKGRTVYEVEVAGKGRLNGYSGARVYAEFSDAGEPGRNDEVELYLQNRYGKRILACDDVYLDGGNHKWHPNTGNGANVSNGNGM